MANEKLTIEIEAQDKASAVLRGVASGVKGELKGIESGAKTTAGALSDGMGAGARAIEKVGSAATETRGEFKDMAGVAKTTGAQVAGDMKGAARATEGVGAAAEHASAKARISFASMSSAAQKYQSEIRAVSMVMVGVGIGTVALASKAIAAYREAEQAEQRLDAAIEGTNQSIDKNRLLKLASDLEKVTTADGDAVVEVEALLTTFNLTQDQIEQLTPRVLNIAAIMDGDLKANAIAVGKAIGGGMFTALQRFGIMIDEDTIKSGNFAGILKAIDRNTGNAAERLAEGAGAIKQFDVAVENLYEEIGRALLPVLREILPPLRELVALASKVPPWMIKGGIGAGLAVGGLGALGLAGPPLARGAGMVRGAARWGAARVGIRAGAGAAEAVGARVGAGTVARVAAGVGAKGLARAIPYIGWGLIAADVANVGYGYLQGHREQQAGEAGVTPASEVMWARARAERATAVAGPVAEIAGGGGYGPVAEPAMAAYEPIAAGPAAFMPRTAYGATEVAPGAWLMPRAGGAQAVAGQGVNVNVTDLPGGGRRVVIELLDPAIASPGVMDDQVTDWMDDSSYAGGMY